MPAELDAVAEAARRHVLGCAKIAPTNCVADAGPAKSVWGSPLFALTALPLRDAGHAEDAPVRGDCRIA